ncbi:MAG: aminoacyl-tRNA hydrolase [Chloroflexi bacterium]|nr:MAG: aminoacyl-tRNA hydrolase [Chloroflexota bacterium]
MLIVGLGNPGRRYQRTRHNIGFMVVDRLARDLPAGTARSRMQAELYETRLGERRVILAKPQTFMNASGESVGQLVRWYSIKRPNLLIVYDDLNLPFGTLRLRPGGSDGGHNGLTSIIQHLGTEQVPRLRVGIGRPVRGSTVPYVLSEFFQDERPLLPGVIERAAAAVHDWMTLGIDAAMNLHNRKPDAEATKTNQMNQAD